MESDITPAQSSSTGVLYKLYGIGNTNGDSPHILSHTDDKSKI